MGLGGLRLAVGDPGLTRRQFVIVRPGVISVSEIEVGRRYTVAVELINLSASPVTVNGYRSDCTCISVAESLPAELPARGRRSFPIAIAAKTWQAGRPLKQSIELYLSVLGARTSISVEGTVAPLTASH